ncbi:MAG: hypothetical protein ABI861_02395 [Panacibacter sp.]
MRKRFHFSNSRWIGIFVLVIIGTLSFVVWNSDTNLSERSFAVSGRINLSKTELKNDAIPLNGEWKFIWGQLKSPQSFPDKKVVLMTLPQVCYIPA